MRQPRHLAPKTASGATDMGCGQVDPGLNLGHQGTPQLGLVRAGRAPWLDHPGPVQEQPCALDPQLGSPSELVTLGEVRRVTLQRCPGVVQQVGGGSQYS